MSAQHHLLAAAAALLVAGATVVAGATYARWVEQRYVHALAPQVFDQKSQGSALQRAAFDQSDLLPIYGSSELPLPTPSHANALFRSYPTGFTIFALGKADTTSLIWLQELAGHALQGRKVVLSISPSFFQRPMVPPENYAGNFSAVHASELVFSNQLSFGVKQQAAQRMLAYPETLRSYPLLRFALANLADGSLIGRALYYAATPVGMLAGAILRLQDHWETWLFLRKQQGLNPDVSRTAATIEWAGLLPEATRQSQDLASNNPFGFNHAFWEQRVAETGKLKGSRSDDEFLRSIRASKEWTDLELLLQGLNDAGARVLLLSMPMNGAYYDYLGISAQGRNIYYDKMREVAREYHATLVDFRDHDGDRYFLIDSSFHLSRKGWLYYDRALDAFFHDRPVDKEIREMSAAEQTGS